jgi:flavin-dependent dehydrogenase
MKMFDVIVVGGGHAGVEACLAAARMEKSVLLITTRVDRLGFMSCNPSIGGLAKGNIVREVDILGGAMGIAADKTCVQFKRLNSKKGPAVRGSRAQCDKDLYCDTISEVVKNYKNIRILESEAKSLVIENKNVEGVVLEDGSIISSRAVILTTGTSSALRPEHPLGYIRTPLIGVKQRHNTGTKFFSHLVFVVKKNFIFHKWPVTFHTRTKKLTRSFEIICMPHLCTRDKSKALALVIAQA